MTLLAGIPMLLAMLSAASCAVLDRCRTTGSVACALVMAICMIDMSWTNLLPLAVVMTAITVTALWAGVSGWSVPRTYDRLLATHRLVSSVAMVGLLYLHDNAMYMTPICGVGTGVQDNPSGLPEVVHSGAAVVLATGVLLAMARLYALHRESGHVADRTAALEPALMGLSIVLMAV